MPWFPQRETKIGVRREHHPRRELLADIEHPAEIWVGGGGGHIADRAGEGETREQTVEDKKTTDLSVVIE